ncbi:ABC transporter permease [Anaerobium acetethylicum]|uniref:Putative aldouronate transport system permease protein n=1 Tax=Anaerobium acetethylicum TaxID=1619234 RepID=A0A1D3TVK5_9FIRM|nr:ABC transporter permease subunit [Anaerobium acetethylicum]SCP98188.1 putative aldouronate transport system permease protein [Anaerobium acetethylicum]
MKSVNTTSSFRRYIKRDWQLYAMLLLPLIAVFIFKYGSFPGIVIAFKDYKILKGISGSDWAGFDVFLRAFRDKDFWLALKNTLVFNGLDLIVGFPMPIILAILLNEVRNKHFKKVSQTVLYLPHFLSWVIIAGVFTQLLSPETGMINILLSKLGFDAIPFLNKNLPWAVTYILVGVWQTMGWGTIIYLTAITGISDDMYEAATVDGAGRWQKIKYITLPSIKGTVIMMLIMNLGRIMASSFERCNAFGNPLVKDVQYQLSIFIYNKGLQSLDYSLATAVGVFQSLVGLLLVLAADRFAKSIGEEGII